MDELIEASRPVSISAEGWRECFPTASDFEEALAKRNRRRIAELENQNPYGANGITDRSGRFVSFKDMQRD